MSKTDNTRPIKVITKDPAARYVNRFGGKLLITGGINSEKRHGKKRRKEATTSRRQHERRALHKARLLVHMPDLIDISPIPADKRNTGWRYA